MTDATNTLNKRCVGPSICPQTGLPKYSLSLTLATQTDTVDLILKPIHMLPIVFLPGIMGSNLRSTGTTKEAVWRLDSNGKLLATKGLKGAGSRQQLLHPLRTEVDDDGSVPSETIGVLKTKADYQARGWGEVGATSYQAFLIWLETQLNGGSYNDSNHSALNTTLQAVTDAHTWDAQKSFEPLTDKDSTQAVKWQYPVYACGYNWLDDNKHAAERVQTRIEQIIKDNNRAMAKCKQVILVTHSMGGLVARACSKLAGMEDKIAGVVHGVMPATGAAVAYRRCKVGMMDEGASGLGLAAVESWGAARVIGATGQEVTAVFAQAPGALQLLPTAQYPLNWLQMTDSDRSLLPKQPSTVDPYESIYKERHTWWGLVKEEWLSPKGGEPIDWDTYLKKGIIPAKVFHDSIKDYYHPNTYGFYGRGLDSFERLTWMMEAGNAKRLGVTDPAPSAAQVMGMHRNAVRIDGTNPESVPAPDAVITYFDASTGMSSSTTIPAEHYFLRLDTARETGDGTVPLPSGRAPFGASAVKQLFAVPNIAHEPAYQSPVSQRITAYAINKIALKAKPLT